MLTDKQRRSVIRVLIKAYYSYRDLSLFRVCRAKGLGVYVDHDEALGGSAGKDYVEIPGKCPKIYKEHVFWHEFCHVLVEGFGFYSRLIGYQGHLQQFDADGGYWVWERLCEAFADLMILYRHLGVETVNVEAFLFEDSMSIGYAEAVRFSVGRVTRQCDEAMAKGRNIDLSDLRKYLEHQERYICYNSHQQMLPTAFYEHHQTPWPTYVDEERDSELRYQFSQGKKTWEMINPWEKMMLQRLESFKAGFAQPRLFEEMTLEDRARLRKRVEWFDKKVQRYQNPNPAT